MLLPVTMSCAKEREYVCVVWSCTDDGGHGTFFCRCLQGMNEAYDTRGCYASQFLPECQFVYALSPFVLVMWLDLQQTGWMMMIMIVDSNSAVPAWGWRWLRWHKRCIQQQQQQTGVFFTLYYLTFFSYAHRPTWLLDHPHNKLHKHISSNSFF